MADHPEVELRLQPSDVADVLAQASARTQAFTLDEDFLRIVPNAAETEGHITTVTVAGISFSCSGDGTRHLVELFRGLADKAEAARTEWLRTKAAEQ